MPRKPRPPRAPKVASGQAYGQRQAQEATLASVPPPTPRGPAPAPVMGGGGGPGRGGSGDPTVALQRATEFQPPALTPLDAPSDRPSEPVTAGLPVGAGPGPEVVGGIGPMVGQQAAQLPGAARLTPYLPVIELLASRPGASVAARNMARMIRGAVGGQGQ